MNNFISLVIVLLTLSISTNQPLTDATLKNIKDERPVTFKEFSVNHEDYTLHFSLENSKDLQHILVVAMELHNDSYYVSPNSKRDFKGKFRGDFGTTESIEFYGDFIETPLSVEEYDPHPFVRGTINWVREDTTYKQLLLLKTQENFQVYGRIIFTIEPRCTLEQIPFSLVYEDGELVFVDAKC
ncbi:MAG: hypothetical protein PSN34_15290 [Urechidicola sp.]|nr:hypothetical protein [Urechidicola sp.]